MLNEQERATQSDLQRAYDWVRVFSREVDAMLIDADRRFSALGFTSKAIVSYGKALSTTAGPVVSYAERVYRPQPGVRPEVSSLLAVRLFSPDSEDGPILIGAAIEGTSVNADLSWSGLYGAAFLEREGLWKRTSHVGPIAESSPTDAANAARRMLWFEVPVVWVSSAERLDIVIKAIIALREGDEKPAIALVENTR